MSNPSCEEVRALAAEVALGIAPGEDRARVLAHTRSCADCRRFLEGLAETADGLLQLAPSHEPSVGFESKVLARTRSKVAGRKPRILAVAAVLAAAAIAGGGVLWSTAEDRELASHYRDALAVANGEYFGVYPLQDPGDERAGHVFAYAGSPSWVFLILEDLPSGSYSAEIEAEDGERSILGDFELQEGDVTWGRDLPMELREVEALRISNERGELALEATFGS